jgi:hypothetical protein|tara:strand:+ start:62951 stop:63628 length:678 start_codon:yes stop_codon:yes gene_type:complete
MNNFIEVYENVLPKEVCEYIIKLYEETPTASYPGGSGMHGNVDYNIKQSIDMNLLQVLSEKPGLKPMILSAIRSELDKHVVEYFRKYPYTQRTSFDKETDDSTILDNLQSSYSFWAKSIIIKKYDKEVGGYHAFHEDCGAESPSLERTLVCMFYLNDVKEGGETEFYHQNVKVPPTQGSLVIFPAYFTHLHKGHVPISNDKYILNLWLLKNNAAHWRIWHSKNKK